MLSCLFELSVVKYRFSNLTKRNLAIATLVCVPSFYVPWLVFCDAFRRFNNFKSTEQVINNKKVFALLLTYLLYAIGATVVPIA